MLVVADTGPLNYLCLVGAIDVVQKLFGRVSLPEAVCDELRHVRAPGAVRNWISNAPEWIDIVETPSAAYFASPKLGVGETAVIAAALLHRADVVLIDDRRAVVTARALGLRAVGTIGLLDRAALRGLIDLPQVVGKLAATNFRCRPELLDALLSNHRLKKPQAQR